MNENERRDKERRIRDRTESAVDSVLIKILVALCVFLAGWIWTMHERNAKQELRIDSLEEQVSKQWAASRNRYTKDEAITWFREHERRLDIQGERIARIEGKIRP